MKIWLNSVPVELQSLLALCRVEVRYQQSFMNAISTNTYLKTKLEGIDPQSNEFQALDKPVSMKKSSRIRQDGENFSADISLPVGVEEVEILVLAPDGTLLGYKKTTVASETNLELNRTWQPISVKKQSFAEKTFKLRGKVMDSKGQTLRNRKMGIYYKGRLIHTTTTDQNGSYSTWVSIPVALAKQETIVPIVPEVPPAEPLSEGKAGLDPIYDEPQLMIQDLDSAESMYVPLEDRTDTQVDYIRLSDAADILDLDSDCSCHDSIHSLPDMEQLVDGTYTQDVGTDCQHFNHPNRTIDEFSFSYILRTTQPRIGTFNNMFSNKNSSLSHATFNENIGIEHLFFRTEFSGLHDIESDELPIQWDEKRVKWRLGEDGDWITFNALHQATDFAHGIILLFKQTYKANGYSLGRLLYSLPLAPGQKKQLAILDWSRVDEARRDEMTDYSEQLQNHLSRDRDVSDIVSGIVKESIQAKSKVKSASMNATRSMSASATVPVSGVPINVGMSGGFSGSAGIVSSNTSQNSRRESSMSAAQKLRDMTTQISSVVRSQRTSVVQTVQQSESVSASTEVVANHNHCHAITMEYFEVLAHYVIEQEFVEARECLFVPMHIQPFTLETISRYADILKDHFLLSITSSQYQGFWTAEKWLLDGAVTNPMIEHFSIFLDVRPYLNCPPHIMASPPATPPANWVSTYQKTDWVQYKDLLSPDVMVENLAFNSSQDAEARFTHYLQSIILNNYIKSLDIEVSGKDVNNQTFSKSCKATLIRTGTFKDLKSDSRTLRIDVSGVNIYEVAEIRIKNNLKLPSFSDMILGGASIKYKDAESKEIVFWQDNRMEFSINKDSGQFSSLSVSNVASQDPSIRPLHALLHHLNNNLEYYYRAIWMNMDESRRYLILDKIKSPQIIGDPTAVVSVAQVVENVVYGVVGNSLVMPVARGIQLDPTYTLTEEANLNDLYRPKESVLRMSVAIPTPGVFAESIMGACNACEKIDKSRMQDWTFATTDEPTSINPLDTSSRYQNPGNLQAKDLPNPIVNIQNAPNAPEPQGFSALSSILGKSDLFKDMTGLEGNQELLLKSLLSDAQNSRYGMQVTAGLVAMAMDKENSQKRLSDLQDKRDKIAGNRNLSPSERAAQLAAVDNEMENEKSKSISLSDYLPQSGSMDSLLKDPLARAGIKSVTQNADGSFKIDMQEGNEGASEESEEEMKGECDAVWRDEVINPNPVNRAPMRPIQWVGQGLVGNLFVQLDPLEYNMALQASQNLLATVTASIQNALNNVWTTQLGINTNGVQVIAATNVPNNIIGNSVLITVGVQGRSATIQNNISYYRDATANNPLHTAYFYYDTNPNAFAGTIAHEFGHMCGLSDRYVNRVSYDTNPRVNAQGISWDERVKRETTPMLLQLLNDQNYTYANNLMSNPNTRVGVSLSQIQRNIIQDPTNPWEANYPTVVLLQNALETVDYDVVDINPYPKNVTKKVTFYDGTTVLPNGNEHYRWCKWKPNNGGSGYPNNLCTLQRSDYNYLRNGNPIGPMLFQYFITNDFR